MSDCTRDVRGYWNGCHCPDCTTAVRAYWRGEKRRAARPDAISVPRLAPPGQVRAHLELLRSEGLGLPEIARRAGVAPRTVYRIVAGEADRVRPATKERLLGVMPSPRAAGALVVSDRAREQLDALRDAGWSERELVREVFGAGSHAQAVELRPFARQRTVDRIAALHVGVFPPVVADGDDPAGAWPIVDGDDGQWRRNAACRHLDGDARTRQAPFFPERGIPADAALEVCGRCPVAFECLRLALASTYTVGIWGRTTGQARRLIHHLGLDAGEVIDLSEQAPEVVLVEKLERLKADRERESEESAA